FTSFCTWAIGVGGLYENSQTVTPHISTDNPALFSVQPAWHPTIGEPAPITFTTAPNADGSTYIYVWATDERRPVNGGANKPHKHSIRLDIDDVDDPPVAKPDYYATTFNTPLVVSAAKGVMANDTDIDGSTDGSPMTVRLETPPEHG